MSTRFESWSLKIETIYYEKNILASGIIHFSGGYFYFLQKRKSLRTMQRK